MRFVLRADRSDYARVWAAVTMVSSVRVERNRALRVGCRVEGVRGTERCVEFGVGGRKGKGKGKGRGRGGGGGGRTSMG